MSVEIKNDSKCHAEFSSASHREPFLVLLGGQILKQVQDDHQLCSVVFCYIEGHKNFMKFNAHPIANSCIEKHILDRRLEDAKSEGRIAAGS